MDNKDKDSEAAFTASVFSIAWPKIRDLLIKVVLVRWIPKVVGGFWGWLAVIVIDHVARPIYDHVVMKVIVAVRKIKHNKQGRDLEQSKTETEFDRSSDDLP